MNIDDAVVRRIMVVADAVGQVDDVDARLAEIKAEEKELKSRRKDLLDKLFKVSRDIRDAKNGRTLPLDYGDEETAVEVAAKEGLSQIASLDVDALLSHGFSEKLVDALREEHKVATIGDVINLGTAFKATGWGPKKVTALQKALVVMQQEVSKARKEEAVASGEPAADNRVRVCGKCNEESPQSCQACIHCGDTTFELKRSRPKKKASAGGGYEDDALPSEFNAGDVRAEEFKFETGAKVEVRHVHVEESFYMCFCGVRINGDKFGRQVPLHTSSGFRSLAEGRVATLRAMKTRMIGLAMMHEVEELDDLIASAAVGAVADNEDGE